MLGHLWHRRSAGWGRGLFALRSEQEQSELHRGLRRWPERVHSSFRGCRRAQAARPSLSHPDFLLGCIERKTSGRPFRKGRRPDPRLSRRGQRFGKKSWVLELHSVSSVLRTQPACAVTAGQQPGTKVTSLGKQCEGLQKRYGISTSQQLLGENREHGLLTANSWDKKCHYLLAADTQRTF